MVGASGGTPWVYIEEFGFLDLYDLAKGDLGSHIQVSPERNNLATTTRLHNTLKAMRRLRTCRGEALGILDGEPDCFTCHSLQAPFRD